MWLSHHPESYVVEICGTGFAAGCTLSAVAAGEEIAARSSFTPGMVNDVAVHQTEPIAALFERVSHAMRSNSCDLKSLEFDSQYGYVSNYYCSGGEEGSGEKVECFRPGTVDLSACPDGAQVK
jgi:hypothetical protein